MIWFTFIIIWVVCAFLNYGFVFAYLQNRFSSVAKEEYYFDLIFSLFTSLFGPISFLTGVIAWGDYWKYGWKIK